MEHFPEGIAPLRVNPNENSNKYKALTEHMEGNVPLRHLLNVKPSLCLCLDGDLPSMK